MKAQKQIAKKYAQALIELAENDLNLQETFFHEIKTINDSLFQTTNSKQIFKNPAISKNEKKELIKNLFLGKTNQRVLNFLFLLIDKQRFGLMAEIQNEMLKLVNKSKGVVVAEIFSANELDKDALENLRQKLESTLGQNEKITIESKIEPGLIGGLKVKINDLVYDGSVKEKLENLKRRLG